MWMTNLSETRRPVNMFYISGVGSLVWNLFIYIAKCPAQKSVVKNATWTEKLGLMPSLFGSYKMALFLFFLCFWVHCN
jgi:NHS family xanthosine MFS transporter